VRDLFSRRESVVQERDMGERPLVWVLWVRDLFSLFYISMGDMEIWVRDLCSRRQRKDCEETDTRGHTKRLTHEETRRD